MLEGGNGVVGLGLNGHFSEVEGGLTTFCGGPVGG